MDVEIGHIRQNTSCVRFLLPVHIPCYFCITMEKKHVSAVVILVP